ncbi:MAG: TetR/AcrR family transcriptional regulator [Sphingomonas fennica]
MPPVADSPARRHRVDPARRAEIGRARKARTRARILAAAFDLFGHEAGLFTTIDQVAAASGITRTTFYNHFTGMEGLREALTQEIAHDFLVAVTAALQTLPDPAERTAAAIRFYLARARTDGRWAWSMLNLSANGVIFGAETRAQAEETVREGMAGGRFDLADSAIGRDLTLGGTLAALGTQAREGTGADFAEQVAARILIGLGIAKAAADEIARRPLPALDRT